MTAWRLNPVLGRELRERARSRRTFIILTLAISLLAVILNVVYVATRPDTASVAFDASAFTSARNGRVVFETMLLLIMLLVCFLVPGLTAGAICGERERQTLVPLQVTLLKPRSLVLGKIGTSLAFVLLLLSSTLPLLSVSLILGGITIGTLLKGLLVVFCTAVLLACLSILCSATLKRSQSATVLAYFLTLVLLAGTLMAFGAQQVAFLETGDDWHDSNKALLVANPLVALTDIISSRTDLTNGNGGSSSPLTPFREFLRPGNTNDVLRPNIIRSTAGVGPGQIIRENPIVLDGPFVPDKDRDLGVRIWIRSLALFAVTCLFCVVVSSRRLRVPADRAAP